MLTNTVPILDCQNDKMDFRRTVILTVGGGRRSLAGLPSGPISREAKKYGWFWGLGPVRASQVREKSTRAGRFAPQVHAKNVQETGVRCG